MIPLLADLYPWVKTQATLTAKLGGAERPRWFYAVAPQQPVRPYVVWRLSGGESTHHQGGKAQLEQPRLVLDVYGDDGAEHAALVSAIDVLLDAFRGAMGATNVRRLTRESMQDLPELRADGSARGTLRTRLEYSGWFV